MSSSARSSCSTSIAGRPLAEGEKSLAWRLTFGSDERTLTEAEVDDALAAVAAGLARDVGGRLRS